jgi:microcystin-dependent protein
MALQQYIPTQWVNGTAPAINSINLNHIENGIEGVTDAVIVLEEAVTDLVPAGLITMFSGAVIPDGWALCDGTQGTPDLVGQFIIGGNGADNGVSGGSRDAVVVAHTHTGTANSVTKTGSFNTTAGNNSAGAAFDASTTGVFNATTASKNPPLFDNTFWTMASKINFSMEHSHTLTVNSSGVSGTDKNLPPYYTLAYIMKLA